MKTVPSAPHPVRMLSWQQVSRESGFTVKWVYIICKRAIEKLKIYEK